MLRLPGVIGARGKAMFRVATRALAIRMPAGGAMTQQTGLWSVRHLLGA